VQDFGKAALFVGKKRMAQRGIFRSAAATTGRQCGHGGEFVNPALALPQYSSALTQALVFFQAVTVYKTAPFTGQVAPRGVVASAGRRGSVSGAPSISSGCLRRQSGPEVPTAELSCPRPAPSGLRTPSFERVAGSDLARHR